MNTPANTSASRASRRARDDGFTLIELIVALAILVMAASLVVPSMRGVTDRTRTRRAVDRITADVALARMSAVREGRQASLRFTSVTTYQVTIDTSTTDPTKFRLVKTVKLTDDYPGVQMDPSSGQLSFNSRGLLQSTSVTRVRVARGTVGDSVTVTPVGRTYRDY